MKYINLKKFVQCGVIFVISIALLVGCDNLLSVENPNSLTEDDVTNPSSATALKNGLLHQLKDAAGWTWAATLTASDELYWDGSYEPYRDFDEGNLDLATNQMTNNGFPLLSQARYMGDYAVENLTSLDDSNELENPETLTRALIYSALTKIIIAENYDNFVISDRTETSEPVGEDKMASVFVDGAIDLLDRAVDRAETDLLEAQALGLRARAKHYKGVWEKLNPPGNTPSDPLVSGTGASVDAQAALDLMDDDYKAQFDFQTPQQENYLADQVNSRGEIAPMNPVFDDIKTGETDPRAEAIISNLTDVDTYTTDYAPLTWLSAREMHLIIAEEAVGTDDEEARDRINTVRGMDNLPKVVSGDDLEAFIEHERRANLFFQGHRLNDMYRFGSTADNWSSTNRDEVGTLLPIPSSEITANPDIN